MIPKWIDRSGKSDNYRALALYVADAKIGHPHGEKTFHHWYAGGDTDNYLEGMIEVETTQAMNTAAKGEKTYHLVVSFRPEDEAKLTIPVLEEIETMLAGALGFSDHQRHCGVHVNTNNMHLHIAYNMIEPRTFKKYVPYYDHRKLHKVCRVIEQKFGLIVDRGLEPDAPIQDGRPSAKVQAIEAQTGQKSFFSYVLRHKIEIMTGLEAAAGWPEVHAAFLKYGLILKLSGNGLVIMDRYGKHRAKASALDRKVSKKNLESRFGHFEFPTPALLRISAHERFTAAPLHQGAENSSLYTEFQVDISRRKAAITDIQQEALYRIAKISDQVSHQKEKIKKVPMLRHDRRLVLETMRKKEREAIGQIREESKRRQDEIRKDIPYTTWVKFLQHKSIQGNETALAILRSKKVPDLRLDGETSKPAEEFSLEDSIQDMRQKVLKQHGLGDRHSNAMLSVLKMMEVLNQVYGGQNQLPDYTVDTKGTIIYRLQDDGRIRDTGSKIHFSTNGKMVKQVAEKYALARWSQIRCDGNQFEIDKYNSNVASDHMNYSSNHDLTVSR